MRFFEERARDRDTPKKKSRKNSGVTCPNPRKIYPRLKGNKTFVAVKRRGVYKGEETAKS